MAGLNRRAVTTDIQKEFKTSFVDINKCVGLITDTTRITTLFKLFTNLEEVADVFPVSSESYAMAKAYFDEGATTLYLVPVTGESSGSLTTIATKVIDFVGIADGEFDITVDGTLQELKGLDFSQIGLVSDIAKVITSGLTGATCTVGIASALVITSDKSGASSTVASLATPSIPGIGVNISSLLTEAYTTTSTKDIIAKLTELENDSTPGFNFLAVGMDKALSLTGQVTGQGALLTNFVFQKEYDLFIDTADVTALAPTQTDPVSINKYFYDNLSGADTLRVGNVNFFYTPTSDFLSFGVMGKFMAQDIGTQTMKFMKPKNSSAQTITNAQLTNLLNKQGNVYTGTNERIGRSFVKEGLTLKNGDYTDTSLGSIWLKVQLEENIYNLLGTKKVPINQDGFELLKNTVTPIFERAISQGIVNGFGSGSFKFEGDSKETIINGGYEIKFSAGDVANREIIGDYVYYEEASAHFITNKVTIKSEA